MSNPSEFTAKPPPGLGSKKLLSTRRGTVALAALSAMAALGVLLVFMSNYRDSVVGGTAEIRVLVADRLVDKGTSGDVIAEAKLFSPISITEDEAAAGALTDPSELRGLVATEEIYKGQQLTAADFSTGADPITGKLEGTQRAIALPLDEAHGNLEQIKTGSRVDILGGLSAQAAGGRLEPILSVLARDVLVLRVVEGENNENSSVVLRVKDSQASKIAFASDAGKLWLTVRPPTLAKDSGADHLKLENVLGSTGAEG